MPESASRAGDNNPLARFGSTLAERAVDRDTTTQHWGGDIGGKTLRDWGHVVSGRQGVLLEGARCVVAGDLAAGTACVGSCKAGNAAAADASHPLDAVGREGGSSSDGEENTYPTRSPSLRPELSVPGPNLTTVPTPSCPPTCPFAVGAGSHRQELVITPISLWQTPLCVLEEGEVSPVVFPGKAASQLERYFEGETPTD